jgi:hypothetical protein
MSTTPTDAAIEDLARAIARGQGYSFDTLYAGPKSQVLRDATSAYHHLTDRKVAAPQPEGDCAPGCAKHRTCATSTDQPRAERVCLSSHCQQDEHVWADPAAS